MKLPIRPRPSHLLPLVALFAGACLDPVDDPQLADVEQRGTVSPPGPVWRDEPGVSWGTRAVGSATVAATKGGVRVYIVDSGIQPHNDLSFASVNPADPGNANPLPGCYAHATHVAGIVDSVAQGVAMVSVSLMNPDIHPDGCLTQVAARPGDYPGQYVSRALAWVEADIARRGVVGIINLSSNDEYFDSAQVRAVIARVATPLGSYKGALVVQSAGNGEVDACTVSYGPAVAGDGVIVVGAINDHGQAVRSLNGIRGFHNLPGVAASEKGSNHGACVEMWAPGAAIYSTWEDDGYELLSGTSMAAPHVAGLAAALWQPGLDSRQLEDAVIGTLRPLGSPDPANPKGVGLSMPSFAEPPDGGSYSAPYAEAYVGLAAPSEISPHNNTLVVHADGSGATTSPLLHVESSGADGHSCDVRRRRLPGGAWTSVGSTPPQLVVGGLSWSVGMWEVGSALCPSASAKVNVLQPPHGYWTINGVRQPASATLTLPRSTNAVLGFESERATRCTLTASRRTELPDGTPAWAPLPGYPRTVTTPNAEVALPREPGLYNYESNCVDGTNLTTGGHRGWLDIEITEDPAIDPVSGLWWNPQRSGNGMDLRVAGDTLELTWFTFTRYRVPVWYRATLARQPGRWHGPLRKYRLQNQVATPTEIGDVTITLTSATTGTFGWRIGGETGSEPFRPIVFDDGGTTPSMSGLWDAPGAGVWGLTVNTQGAHHYAVLTVYDGNGSPTWVTGLFRGDQPGVPVDLIGVTGTNLYPGCPDAPSRTNWEAGTMSIDLTALHLGRASVAIDADLAGGVWQRAVELQRRVGL